MSKELICPCPSCGGKALDQCEPQCHDGQERRDAVAGQIKEGKSHDQILQYMAATYGTQILGEPPREGWGAMSVLMPLACLAAGALPLMWFTRSRKSSGPKRSETRRAPAAAPTEDARVAAALKEFDF
jgi:cytochrome c-type biogenesis protein CcmH/NrfF